MTGIEKLAACLKAQGRTRVAFCPGVRALGILEAIRAQALEVITFYDERSAAFFAVGSPLQTVVVTTSGTAVGELLPAVMEASHQKLPLIVVTADRPERFRSTGSPQTTDQRKIFGVFAEFIDWNDACQSLPVTGGPLQINVSLEDPIRTRTGLGAAGFENWNDFIAEAKNPLVIVGELGASERSSVTQWLLHFGAPVYLEALSGLRESGDLASLAVPVLDPLLKHLPVDRVVRVGAVPVHRIIRDLEGGLAHLPIAVLGSRLEPGVARPVLQVTGLPSLAQKPFGHAAEWREEGARALRDLSRLMERYPSSEPAQVAQLSGILPAHTHVYLGNSMPIRTWDLAASRAQVYGDVGANRGLNGIDGQVSSFYGFASARASEPSVALLGDLTAMHDLNGFWAARFAPNTSVVVMQNRGGRIFDYGVGKPLSEAMINPADFDFEHVAALYGLEYQYTTDVCELSRGRPKLIELESNLEATRGFWSEFREL